MESINKQVSRLVRARGNDVEQFVSGIMWELEDEGYSTKSIKAALIQELAKLVNDDQEAGDEEVDDEPMVKTRTISLDLMLDVSVSSQQELDDKIEEVADQAEELGCYVNSIHAERYDADLPRDHMLDGEDDLPNRPCDEDCGCCRDCISSAEDEADEDADVDEDDDDFCGSDVVRVRAKKASPRRR